MSKLVKLLGIGLFAFAGLCVLPGCTGGDTGQAKPPAESEQDQQDGSAAKPESADQGSNNKNDN